MGLDWRTQGPATDGDDAGSSLHFATVDDAAIGKDVALREFWHQMVRAVFHQYPSEAWDTVSVDVRLVKGQVFAYPEKFGAESVLAGPRCTLDLLDLGRRIEALNNDTTVSQTDYPSLRAQIADEYARAIETSAKHVLGCESVRGRWVIYGGVPRSLIIRFT
jgi:hypothetical protein